MILLLMAVALAAGAAPQTQSTKAQFDEYHKIAETHAAQGNLRAAIPYFEKARSLDPSHYVNGYDLALAYQKTGALDKARGQIVGMLEREDKAELHNLLGTVEEEAGAFETAAKEFQKAALMEPTEKNVFDFGNCLIRHNVPDDALKIFNWGVEKYPKSARMRIGLGVTYYARGEYDRAVEVLCEGVDLDPSDQRPIYFLGKMYDVSFALADEVTKRLERLATLYPNNAAASYYYALSLWKNTTGLGSPVDLPKVEKHLKNALRSDPGMADAHFQLGLLYEQQQKYALAILEMETAVRIQPGVETFHYRLAQVYRKNGEEAKADTELQRFRELHSRKKVAPSVETTSK